MTEHELNILMLVENAASIPREADVTAQEMWESLGTIPVDYLFDILGNRVISNGMLSLDDSQALLDIGRAEARGMYHYEAYVPSAGSPIFGVGVGRATFVTKAEMLTMTAPFPLEDGEG